MSVKIMSAIFESTTLGPTERLIMLALADHADDDGCCYPSIARLCQRTGLGERAMQSNIRKLQDVGHLRIVPGGGRSRPNLYIVVANPAQETPFRRVNPAPETPFETTNPASAALNPAFRALNPAPDAPEPSITIKEPSDNTPLVPLVVVSQGPPEPRRRARAIPQDWVPSDKNISQAKERGFTDEEINEQSDAFRDYHLSRGTSFKDWDAAWRTWLGNARRFARTSAPPNAGSRSGPNALFAGFQRAASRQ